MSVKCGMRNSGSGIAVRGGAAARSAAGTTQHVRLGDVAEEVRENWSGPKANVPVVGLEHIEPDEIWLRKWEVNPDENTFSKAFRKGQLLFGRRRAYQKKLSLAPSDGICSGDITVIAAKSDKVVPSLLPFLLRTDKFFDYAIQGSAGSLSPRVKWAHLAKYEFDLPPLDEQKKLAELLWAANDLKESYKKAITATDEMLKAKFREMFTSSKFNVRSLVECCKNDDDVKCGPFGSQLGQSEYCNSGVAVWEIPQVNSGCKDAPTRFVTQAKAKTLQAYSVCAGDIVMSRKGDVGRCALFPAECVPGIIHSDIIRIRVNTDIVTPEYVMFQFHLSHDVRQQIMGVSMGSIMRGINVGKMKAIKIPVPPLSLQREFVAIADKAESAKANLKKSIAAIDQVMKGLINHV